MSLRGRSITAIAALVVPLLVAAAVTAGAQDASVTLSDPAVFTTMSRPAVPFTHADHAALDGVSCLTCHHVYEKGKNVLDPGTLTAGDPSLRCATCHKTPADLQRVFHLQCITCHDAQKREGKITGPRQCGECHLWGK
jgi:hypothetical protein